MYFYFEKAMEPALDAMEPALEATLVGVELHGTISEELILL